VLQNGLQWRTVRDSNHHFLSTWKRASQIDIEIAGTSPEKQTQEALNRYSIIAVNIVTLLMPLTIVLALNMPYKNPKEIKKGNYQMASRLSILAVTTALTASLTTPAFAQTDDEIID